MFFVNFAEVCATPNVTVPEKRLLQAQYLFTFS